MTFFLPHVDIDPGQQWRGFDTPEPSLWDGVSEAWGASDVTRDANFYRSRMSARTREDMAEQIADQLGDEAVDDWLQTDEGQRAVADQERFNPGMVDMDLKRLMYRGSFGFVDHAFQLAKDRDLDFDLSDEALDATTTEAMQADYREAMDILDTLSPGQRTAADLVGSIGSGVADVRNIPFLLFGGGSSVLRVAAREAALNVAAEIVTLPSQYAQAERLQIPDPDLFETLAYAAAGGAILGGGVAALGRGVEYLRGARATERQIARRHAMHPVDAEVNAGTVERALEDGRSLTEAAQLVSRRPTAFDDMDLTGMRAAARGSTAPRGQRVEVGFDDWVQGPRASADTRLPRGETAIPVEAPPARFTPPDEVMAQVEAHALDGVAARHDPQAFAQRDALLVRQTGYRQALDELETRYEGDRSAAAAGAGREVERLSELMKETRGKGPKAQLRQQIAQAKSDATAIEGLKGGFQSSADTQHLRRALVEVDQALRDVGPGSPPHARPLSMKCVPPRVSPNGQISPGPRLRITTMRRPNISRGVSAGAPLRESLTKNCSPRPPIRHGRTTPRWPARSMISG